MKMSPVGVEPTSPASEADTLSIRPREQVCQLYLLLGILARESLLQPGQHFVILFNQLRVKLEPQHLLVTGGFGENVKVKMKDALHGQGTGIVEQLHIVDA